ncbi:MAG: OmpA/MotB family protein [Planctomycetota bacterium]
MARAKKQETPKGAPEWMVTYGDAMTLLLCFFVIIVSMSEIKKDERFQQVMESLRKAFGGYVGSIGRVPIVNDPTNTLIAKLLEIDIPELRDQKGDSDEEGIHGRKFRVTNVRDGLEVVVGGLVTFDRFSATLKPQAREIIVQTAELLRGYNTKLLIRGHATREPLPEDSLYEDARDLSYARAREVARALQANGVRPVRLILVAASDTEPLVRQAYTEERRALNRRVEILVTEDLIDDYAGSTLADDIDVQPGDERKGRGRMIQGLIIAALMVVEGVGVFIVANSLNADPDAAMAAEGGQPGAGGAGGEPDALAEVELAKCRPGNSTSGKYVSFNIRISALVASADRQHVEQLVKEKRARIEDRVNYVIRSAQIRQLSEPGFETVKRRLKHEMDRLFGDDTLIKGILIPELLQ